MSTTNQNQTGTAGQPQPHYNPLNTNAHAFTASQSYGHPYSRSYLSAYNGSGADYAIVAAEAQVIADRTKAEVEILYGAHIEGGARINERHQLKMEERRRTGEVERDEIKKLGATKRKILKRESEARIEQGLDSGGED